MKKYFLILFAALGFFMLIYQSCTTPTEKQNDFRITAYDSGKPYTRWWWHAMKFSRADVRNQLIWLKDMGFGGVEISFIYPVNRNPDGERFEWLGNDWQEMVVFAKRCADSLCLGCDFTFGTLWPFGGTFVSDADRTKRWGDSSYKQPLRLSWTHPDTGNVIDHLNRDAFNRYAEVMGKALAPAINGSQSALFCDSWEVHTKYLWTDGFEEKFKTEFGYHITPFMDEIYEKHNKGPRYDYMKMIASLALNEFYLPFHNRCRELGAISRAQCAGSPTDLIRAYSVMDVPETEAMLYEPTFSNIVASAAALSQKPLITSESFTCIYGWPDEFIRREQTADLKLVADALFANGVNQHIWHGTPFNPIGVDTIYFYASVHVGVNGSLAGELQAFNDYLTKVSKIMRFGQTYSDVAVYLPLEDSRIDGILPEDLQMPWSWGAYELRYEYFDDALQGFHPLWINADFLSKGKIVDNRLKVNNLFFDVLFIDADYLDLQTLKIIYKLAKDGLPVLLKKKPKQAGHIVDERFEDILAELNALTNVSDYFPDVLHQKPLITGDNIPDFWCRTDGKSAYIFFANPLAKGLKYPVAYGQSVQTEDFVSEIEINYGDFQFPVQLRFAPYQSLLLKIDANGNHEFVDIGFVPKKPVQSIH
jgi:hypothetical protein